ncbi:TlpA family protein disulfide reductase [Kocuria sp. HSID16901]|uniref:TlpA family protein disulfide reductase n=1 Tax=Kocuria sp. HSID16901 TaxID=2419505 RepID=UPI00065F9178|nr:MauE/DoxX family redox-associated membrane protein [Kocuria sp. HSID16901]RUQ23237.1 hypothetical protein D8M21_00510 [Kocuria sp. HSID16901]
MTAHLAPAVILAVILVFSGVAKCREPGSVRAALENLRVPLMSRGRLMASVFPWAEIVLGLLIVGSPGVLATVIAALALLLFAAYWVLIYRALGFGESVSCHCFGSTSSGRVTRRTLWRNTVFLLLAVWWMVVSCETSVPELVRSASASDALWALGLVAVGTTVFTIMKDNGAGYSSEALDQGRGRLEEPRRADGPHQNDAGEPSDELDYVRLPIPGVVVQDAHGELVSLRRMASTQARLVLWVSAGCGSCSEVMRQAAQWRQELAPAVGVHLMTPSSRQALETVADRSLWDSTLYDVGHVVTDVMDLAGTPAAVLLGADGLLAGGPVLGREVMDFVRDVRAELEAAQPNQDRSPE